MRGIGYGSGYDRLNIVMMNELCVDTSLHVFRLWDEGELKEEVQIYESLNECVDYIVNEWYMTVLTPKGIHNILYIGLNPRKLPELIRIGIFSYDSRAPPQLPLL